MAQTQIVRGVATTISHGADNLVVIRYHQTDVVTFNDKEIILNTGGWFTATTKTRMNQTSNQYNLGFSIQQVKGFWRVHLPNGSVVAYGEGKNDIHIIKREVK